MSITQFIHALSKGSRTMPNLKDMPDSWQAYTELDSRVLAVVVKRRDSWCVYVGAVPGQNHAREMYGVALRGSKQLEPVARAIIENLFHPGFNADGLPYAEGVCLADPKERRSRKRPA